MSIVRVRDRFPDVPPLSPRRRSHGQTTAACVLAATVAVVAIASQAHAGFFGRSSSVGGVLIDSEGVLDAPLVEVRAKIRAARVALREVPSDLNQFSALRKVSLRRLDDAIRKYRSKQLMPLPDEFAYLAGLQRIEYVFVYPDEKDVILAGPAEGWKVDALGNVVGNSTSEAVLLLDDLIVALRTVVESGRGVMSCSIDPSPDGIRRVSNLKHRAGADPQLAARQIEEAMGPQQITIEGVAPSSHLACLMVAADFRMKRLAMNFEEAPVSGMPSYLHLIKAGRAGMHSMQPRWWLAPNYEPLVTDPEGLSWQLRGPGVRCLAEEELVGTDGTRRGTGKSGRAVKAWADNMTREFDELARHDSVFGQLRGVMDLAVVAALIDKEDLLERAGIELPYLMREERVTRYNIPKQVSSQASVLKKGRQWVVSVSGGVEIVPREIVQRVEVSQTDWRGRDATVSHHGNWWWD